MKIPAAIEKSCISIGNQDILSNPNTFHIGYGTDENFVMPMGVSMVSILENNKKMPVAFHVLTEHISEKSQNLLSQIIQEIPNSVILIHQLELHILDDLPMYSSLGRASYYRIFLDQILPEQVSRILYLDGDIICLGDLQQLASQNFEKFTVMAVKDVPTTALKQEKKFHLTNYCNSGMLFINLPQWKKEKIPEKFLDVCYSYKEKLNHLDQDALNIILENQKKILDNRYNYIPEANEPLTNLPERTLFLHYAGTKPWYCWLEFPLQYYFKKYYALSPWKSQSLAMPRNYREMHYLSRYLQKKGDFGGSCYWLFKYLLTKVRTKL